MDYSINATAFHESLMENGYTESEEWSTISTNLHVSIFQALLMGKFDYLTYEVTKQPSKHYIVPITVTMLYLCNLAIFGVQWYTTKLQFVDNYTYWDPAFLAMSSRTPLSGATMTVGSIINTTSLVLSDGLLIWRCHNLWNCSFRIISIPVFLTIGEAGEHSSSMKSVPPKLMRSSSVAVDAILAISNIASIPIQHTPTNIPLYVFNSWTSMFVFPLSGISTTIMVARVATLSNDTKSNTTLVPLTGLQS
ncbi:hypothetical protein BDN70DRAFT_897235 [Pholiota conissans]|uniref:Uncharacterized protein n=1 Tax=Pholiota conissans TaxID=109636 RepID=A0A9P5YVG9_9AGAR|nr:hypothetical protein BDN70DRAFT_897235 [Pholiota conissans]